MKVECPVCGVQGFLEIRGNSQRVCHYKGMVDGKRVYERHPIGNNGNQSMGINKRKLEVNSHIGFIPHRTESGSGDSGSLDPGSNPGSPITN